MAQGKDSGAGSSNLKHLVSKAMENSPELVFVAPPHPYFIRHEQEVRLPREINIQELIERADRYVSVSQDGYASIAAAHEEVMTVQEAEYIKHLVEIHNLESIRAFRQNIERPSKRPQGADTGTSDTGTAQLPLGGAPTCVPQATVMVFWWGFRINMNHCLIDLITSLGGIGKSTTDAIVAILDAAGAAASVWIGLAAGIIATMFAWLSWADGYCGDMGANYNQSWTVQGWVTTVC